MRVEIADYIEGARAARGVVVVIDVFRAFTVACYAIAGGAARIIPVAGIEDARALKRDHPDWLTVGERHARRLEGFDFGNSPTQIEAADLRGRTLVHTTHSGTQGLANATQADVVFTGALVNAAAVCRAIRALDPARVTLVRMGHEARSPCAGDDACAELLAARLAGRDPDVRTLRERQRPAPSLARFFDSAAPWAPESDFERATRVDAFDFALQLVRGTKPPELARLS